MKAATLQRALPVVAGMIADRTGVEVKFGGAACTDGKVIYLPALPITLEEDDFVRAIGYIYHECGHVIDTDFSVPFSSMPLHRAITNQLEDIRIEKIRMIRSSGARRYLNRLVDILTKNGLEGKPEAFQPVPADESFPATSVFQAFLLYKLRHDVLGQVGIKPLVDTAEAAMARFPQGMRTKLEALMFEVEQCESTADVHALATEIVRMIEEEQAQEEQQQQEQSSAQAGDDDEQSDGSSTPSDESSEHASGQDGTGDEQDDTSKDQSQQGQAGDESGQSESDDVDQSQSSSANGGSGHGQGSSVLKELLSTTDEQVMETLDEMLQRSLDQAANDAAMSGRVVRTANVHPMRLPNKQADTSRIKGAINAIRVRTMAWMSSAAECDTQLVHAGRQLDYSRLHQARFGGPIFTRVEEGVDLNADISILIDRSGSMTDGIHLAAEAALATLLAYDIQGINTQVAAFPTGGYVNGDLDSDGVSVIKRWDESPRFLGGRIQSLTADGSTPMAEAMLWATCDLLKRDEARKILLVVTDGDPDDRRAANEVIDLARANGVHVLGLGIESDTKPMFGAKNAAVISDINELTSSMVKLVKQAMSN